jgi:hypothetical protein
MNVNKPGDGGSCSCAAGRAKAQAVNNARTVIVIGCILSILYIGENRCSNSNSFQDIQSASFHNQSASRCIFEIERRPPFRDWSVSSLLLLICTIIMYSSFADIISTDIRCVRASRVANKDTKAVIEEVIEGKVVKSATAVNEITMSPKIYLKVINTPLGVLCRRVFVLLGEYLVKIYQIGSRYDLEFHLPVGPNEDILDIFFCSLNDGHM